jgi:hypothetical protein
MYPLVEIIALWNPLPNIAEPVISVVSVRTTFLENRPGAWGGGT